MATEYKILGQSLPSANTNTDLYTVPSGYSAVCSTLSVCSTASNAQYSILVRQNGAAANLMQYVVYNANVAVNDTALLTLGITLGSNDVITINSTVANVAFNLFGTEIA